MDLERFARLPLLGILRGIESGELAPVIESAASGGLQALEITMNTRDAARLIAAACEQARGRMAIGAGTVLGLDSLKAALDAGATFIVMPTLVSEVVLECADRGVPVFPGALTPQEIHDAWRAGAAMVKVFPSKFFGPSYFSEIKGPFEDVKLLACGGVNADNLGDYHAAGADAFAFGEGLFRRSWIEQGDFARIEAAVRALVDAYRSETSLS